jgi:uncharacterized protein YhbP (UPF0306 family)
MSATLSPPVADYLERHHVMTLATCGPDGPWAAAVFYVNDGENLFFLSSPNTRHCRNLALDPRCAATVHDDTRDWVRIKGVQLEGAASELHGADEARARQLYGAKFPLVRKLEGAPAVILAALAKVRWYRLRAERLYLIDNSRGFGHREQVDL